jgi:flagellar hook-length control protein FliK
VNTINITNLMNAAGLQNPAGTAVNSGQVPGLADFLGMILGGTMTAATTGQIPTGTSNVQDLTAKIAGILKAQPQGPAADALKGLMAALEGIQGTQVATPDLLQKIAKAGEAPATTNTGFIRPTLLADLTAAQAPHIQADPNLAAAEDLRSRIETLVPAASAGTQTQIENIAPEQVAQSLNDIAPEAGGATAATFKPDIAVLVQLKAVVSDTATPKANAQAMLETLEDMGLDDKAVQNYMAALAPPAQAAPVTTQFNSLTVATTEAGTEEIVMPQPMAPRQPDMAAQEEDADTSTEAAAQQKTPGGNATPQPRNAAQDAAAQQKFQGAAHPAAVNMMAQEESSAPVFTTSQDGAVTVQALGAAPAGTTQTTMPGTAAAPVTQTVAVQIQRNAIDKVGGMTLQLHPAELGRLDIKLKFGKDGTIKAQLTADKPETLALLQKDSAHLQRALQAAGFDIDDSSLSFDLQQGGSNQQQNLQEAYDNNRQNAQGGYGRYAGGNSDNALTANIAVQAAYGTSLTRTGVDIMV